MEAIRQIACTEVAGRNTSTAQIRSVDGTPMFQTVIFQGNSSDLHQFVGPNRNHITTRAEADALRMHAEVLGRVSHKHDRERAECLQRAAALSA